MLVLGAGPLGLVHLAKAELLGAGRLMAVDVFAPRLEAARRWAPTWCSTPRRRPPTNGWRPRARATDGYGADVVVHWTGHASTFPEALALVRLGGTVIEPGTFVDMATSA